MNLPQNKTLLRWILIATAFLVVTLILWNTNVFFQKFKLEERSKMEVLATAYENMNNPDLTWICHFHHILGNLYANCYC